MSLSKLLLSLVVTLFCTIGIANEIDINLLPKFGDVQKSAKQIEADKKFLATMDKHFDGDLSKASEYFAQKGWKFLYERNLKDSMRRFNQSWLIDSTNGSSLWGMAILVGGEGNIEQSFLLFREADKFIQSNSRFESDFARAMNFMGLEKNDQQLVEDSFSKFAQVYEKDPEYANNLQNWAIAFFYASRYEESWEKVSLYEKLTGKEMDANFIADLSSRASRP